MSRLALASIILVAAVRPPSRSHAQELVGAPPCVGTDTVVFDAPAPRIGMINAGAGFMLVAPRFESSPAFTVLEIRDLPGGIKQQRRQIEEFSFGPSFAPRVWLGLQGADGIGARIRWWHYDDGDQRAAANAPIPAGAALTARTVTAASPLISISPPNAFPAVNSVKAAGLPGLTDILTVDSSLKLDVWDLEGTFGDIQLGNWSLLVGGGLRYARVDQDYNAALVGGVPQFLRSNQSFKGIGPLMSLEATRPLSAWGLSAYGVYRMALLYGPHRHDVFGQTLGFVTPLALTLNEDHSSRDRFVPWFELEFGLEWARRMGNLEPFIQLGVQAQAVPMGSGANDYGNMGLIGLALNTGLKF